MEERRHWYLGQPMRGTYSDEFLKALGYAEAGPPPLILMKDIKPIMIDGSKYKFEFTVPSKT